MTPEQAFSLANTVALVAWIILIVAGRKRAVSALLTGVIVPLLLAVAYTGLVAWRLPHDDGGFGSLAQVAALFREPWALLAGWIHFLVFDLFIGSWEARDAVRHHVPWWQLAPCQVLTFLFGPAGLLLYFLVRRTRGAHWQLQPAN